MSNKDINKEFIATTKKLLSEKGYDVKTSHLYDIFSKLSGYKDWHQASVKDVKLANSIKKYVDNDEQLIVPPSFTDLIRDSFGSSVHASPFNLFNPKLSAWNYSISGSTGSGKSTLTSKIIGSVLKQSKQTHTKTLINILEMGHSEKSYQKVVSLAGGKNIFLTNKFTPSVQILELQPEQSVPTPDKIKKIAKDIMRLHNSFTDIKMIELKIKTYYNKLSNPYINLDTSFKEIFNLPYTNELKNFFNLQPGEMEPNQEQCNHILNLLDIFLSSGDKINGFQSYNKDEVSEILLQTYRTIGLENRFPTLTDLIENAKHLTNNNNEATMFINKLSMWSKSGSNSMFDLPTTLDLSSDINLFNLAGLEYNPLIQSAYGLIISNLAYLKFKSTPDCKKIFITEDISALLTTDSYQKTFCEQLRISRIFGIATISICQSLNDFFHHNSDIGKSIISLFKINIIGKTFNQEKSDRISLLLNLNESAKQDMEKLGLYTATGLTQPFTKFTRFLVTGQEILGHEIFENYLNPFEETLYSTNSGENAIIAYYTNHSKQFDNLLDTIKFISEKKHFGDIQLIKFLENSGFNLLASKIKTTDT